MNKKLLLFIAIIFLTTDISLAGPFSNVVVIIDAGHGGSDTGSIGIIPNKPEKVLNLEKAIALRDRLKSLDSSVKIIMTRKTDVDVSLRNRRKRIQETWNEYANPQTQILFISIHHNASGGSGTETYYGADNVGTPENPLYFSNQDDIDFAKVIDVELVKLGLTPRTPRPKPSYLMARGGNSLIDPTNPWRIAAIPSILTEIAFIDNQSDIDKIGTLGSKIDRALMVGTLRHLDKIETVTIEAEDELDTSDEQGALELTPDEKSVRVKEGVAYGTFVEDFEDDLSQWINYLNKAVISREYAHSGTQSMTIKDKGYILKLFPVVNLPSDVEVWFYDDDAITPLQMGLQVDYKDMQSTYYSVTTHIGIAWGSTYNYMIYYSIRVSPGWYKEENFLCNRSIGWHKLSVKFTDANVSFLVDDVVYIVHAKELISGSGGRIRLELEGSSEGTNSCWDDVVVTNVEKSVTEGTLISTMKECPDVYKYLDFSPTQSLNDGTAKYEYATEEDNWTAISDFENFYVNESTAGIISYDGISSADVSAKKIKFRATLTKQSAEAESPELDKMVFEYIKGDSSPPATLSFNPSDSSSTSYGSSLDDTDSPGEQTAQFSSVYKTPNSAFIPGEVFSYPNPAKNGKNPKIHIECGVADRVSFDIYNVAGELVHTAEMSNTPNVVWERKYAYEYDWNVSNIASGVYIYTIKAEKEGEKDIKATGKCAIIK